MAQGQSGYWNVEQCRWVGAEPTYVVPPDARPAAEQVPTQREGPKSAVDAPDVGLAARV